MQPYILICMYVQQILQYIIIRISVQYLQWMVHGGQQSLCVGRQAAVQVAAVGVERLKLVADRLCDLCNNRIARD